MGAATVGREAARNPAMTFQDESRSIAFCSSTGSSTKQYEAVSPTGIFGTRGGPMTEAMKEPRRQPAFGLALSTPSSASKPAWLVQVQFAPAPTWKSAAKKRKERRLERRRLACRNSTNPSAALRHAV